MFSKILSTEYTPESLEGTELDTDMSKKMYSTYVPQDVLENEIYNQTKPVVDIPNDIEIKFAQKFIEKGGKFVYGPQTSELVSKISNLLVANMFSHVFLWEEDLCNITKDSFSEKGIKIERTIDKAQIAISHCEYLIADEGTIILNPNQNRFRPLDNFPQYQIVVATKSQIKVDLDHAVSDFIDKHQDVFPFIIDISENKKSTRFAMNKPILLSRGTNNIFVFYTEDFLK